MKRWLASGFPWVLVAAMVIGMGLVYWRILLIMGSAP